MRRATKKKQFPEPPEVRPGNWRGEIISGHSVSFGQAVQNGPPRRSVEFSYIVMPAALTSPEADFTWPGVVLIFAPTAMKPEPSDAGLLLTAKHLPSLSLALQVTRNQFSDMLRMLEANGIKEFHFVVEEGAHGSWPIHSWGMSVRMQMSK